MGFPFGNGKSARVDKNRPDAEGRKRKDEIVLREGRRTIPPVIPVSLKKLAGEVQESIWPEQVSLKKLSGRLWPAREAGRILGMARKACNSLRSAPFHCKTAPSSRGQQVSLKN